MQTDYTLENRLRLKDLSPEKRATVVEAVMKKLQSVRSEPYLERRNGGSIKPLSYAQERLWFMHQLEPESTAYNLSYALRLKGDLDRVSLQRSMNEIVRRHEILRTTFAGRGEEPAQLVAEPSALMLAVIDLRGLNRAEDLARQIRNWHAGQLFDLQEGPLLRVALVQLDSKDHVLLLAMHHIICDGWSVGVLINEFNYLYYIYAERGESQLEELPIQYGDYAAWQREWLQEDRLARLLQYWKDKLSGLQELRLPTDYPRPAIPTRQSAALAFQIPPEVLAKLQELCQRHEVTLFTVMLAVLQIVLGVWAGQQQATVGTDVSNRNRVETEGLIGFFVNQLVLATEWRSDWRFIDLLAKVSQTVLEAHDHQDIPFEKLVHELEPKRELNRAPLFQVKLVLQNAQDESVRMPGLDLEPFGTVREEVKVDLQVSLSQRQNGVWGRAIYSTELFHQTTVERIVAQFQRVLSVVAADPTISICDLELVEEDVKTRLLFEWNGSQRSYQDSRLVHELFAAQAERGPDRIAIAQETQQLSYHTLNSHANQLARYLRSLGVGPETCVGLLGNRSAEMVLGLLGILKAGGAYIPIAGDWPPQRVARMIEDSGIGIVVTTSKYRDNVPGYFVQTVCVDQDWELIGQESCQELSIRTEAETLAYAIFTSGSTGRPKAVGVEHRQLLHYVQSMGEFLGLAECESFCLVSTLAADLGYTVLFPGLSGGGRLSLAPEWASGNVADFLVQEQVDCIKATPLHWRAIMEEGAGRAVFPTTHLVLGGESSDWDWAQKLHRMQAGCQIWNHYGPTECTVGVTAYRLPVSDKKENRTVPIGTPFPNTQVYVLSDGMNLAPGGAIGELYIGGLGVSRGYLNNPDLTAERFVPNSYSQNPGERLYRTGDRAKWSPEGNLEFVGRKDHQLKIRGYRVELGEIEEALREHVGVAAAVAEVMPGHEGAGHRLNTYVVLKPHYKMAAEELRRHLSQRLPDYMVPAGFVFLSSLPLTANGKIDHAALGQLESVENQPEYLFTGPRTPLEEIIGNIWKECLELKEVDVFSNFFELGGHSLLATLVISRVRSVLDIELPLRFVFDSPTVAGFANEVERYRLQDRRRQAPPLQKTEQREAWPLSFAQQRLWFLNQLEPESTAYNLSYSVRLQGKLDTRALTRSITEIVRRHHVLRTSFHLQDGGPVQKVNSFQPVLMTVDLRSVVEAAELARLIGRQEGLRAFDLSQGSLLRTTLVQLGEDDHVVLLTMHHIVSDAWSMGIMVREMMELYAAAEEKREPVLQELPIQYADYAVWQREWLQGEVLDDQVKYWREELAGLEVLYLPTDYPRPAVLRREGGHVGFHLSTATTEKLEELSRLEGVTPFMILLGAYQLVLGRWTGQEDVAVGTPIANRNRVETEGLIGFFVNTLVMRTNWRDRPTFRELLRRLRETVLQAYEHQEVPFEKLVEELQPKRELDRLPLFPAGLMLQNVPSSQFHLPRLSLTGFGDDKVGPVKLDLTLMVRSAGKEMVGTAEYAAELFAPATVERLLGHLQRVLELITADPDRPVAELDLLSEAERRQLLEEWNINEICYADAKTIRELFTVQIEERPDATAVVWAGQCLTYGELERRSNKLAHYLQKSGVRCETRVGICLDRSVDLVIAILASLKSGGAYVPLDPEYPAKRLVFMLENSQTQFLLTQEKFIGLLPMRETQIICMDTDWEYVETQPEQGPGALVEGDNIAYVVYTSGSTGHPKGVMVRHHGVVNLALAQKAAFKITAQSRVLQFASINFDASVSELMTALLSGATLILPGGSTLLAGLGLEETLLREQISVVTLPPSVLESLGERDYPALETLVVAGERCASELADRWSNRRLMLNAYGPTEITVCATISNALRGKEVPIGRPMENMYVFLLDDQMRPVPSGVSGELYVGGIGLARGYSCQPDLTADRFVPNSFSKVGGERLYRTGDICRWQDGKLFYLDRIDHQMKLRGHRIEPGEIETVLLKHPKVRAAVVVMREDRPGDKRLVAYVVNRLEEASNPRDVALWPSVEGYGVFDDFLYLGMAQDKNRLQTYENALRESVAGKVVLDLGTGPDALLARVCIDAGARRVYAIEMDPESYRRARLLVHMLGMQERLILLEGDATQINLPEPVQVCVSSIVGAIGGTQGVVAVLNKVRRLLDSDGIMIPQRCVTQIAVAKLPEQLHAKLRFDHLAAHYTNEIFHKLGYRFDLRMAIKNFPEDHLVSNAATFEDLNFDTVVEVEARHAIELTIREAERVDGFLLWVNLHANKSHKLDILRDGSSLQPIFLPVFYPGRELNAGDKIILWCSRRPSTENSLYQDYEIEGEIVCSQGNQRSTFRYHLPHYPRVFQNSPFYKELFSDWREHQPHPASTVTASELQQWTRESLPEYMVPGAFVFLKQLPLLPNGKVDRPSLPEPDFTANQKHNDSTETHTPLEEILIEIARHVLKRQDVELDDNFFQLGGHSLLAIQLVYRIRHVLTVDLTPRAIFETPSMRALAAKIREMRRTSDHKRVPPIVAVKDKSAVPLSFAQQRLWFLDQLEPGNTAYNIGQGLRMAGRLDEKALRMSFEELVRRHEVLRTTFAVKDGKGIQRIAAEVRVEMPAVDLEGVKERVEVARVLAEQEEQRGFDLEAGPLTRILLVKLGEQDHILLATQHHIISDGWSVAVMVQELGELYERFRKGKEANLGELEIQYADYAVWQREWVKGEVWEEEMGYWRKQMEGLRVLEIPTDYTRSGMKSRRGGRVEFHLGETLRRKLEEICREQGMTMYMILLAGLQVMLGRWGGQEDVAVGTVAANRNRLEIEGLIGFFVNTLVIRTKWEDNPNWKEMLVRVRNTVLEAYDHQEVPFEKLVEELHPEREMNRTPLFQVMMTLQNAPQPKLEMGGLKVSNFQGRSEVAKFDLALVIAEAGGDLRGVMEYPEELFKRETVERMVGHLQNICSSMVSNLHTRVCEATMLSEIEESQLVRSWNGHKVKYPERSLHGLFEDQMQRCPESVAVEFDNHQLTYQELNRRANQLGYYLRLCGLGPDKCAGLAIGRSLEMIIGVLAILKAGGAYVPLDLNHPAERLEYMIKDAQVVLVVTREQDEQNVPTEVRRVCMDRDWQAIEAVACENVTRAVDSDHLAYVIYTSGSTGRPKGVLVSHGGVVNMAESTLSMSKDWGEIRSAQFSSLVFDASVLEMIPGIFSGGSIYIPLVDMNIGGSEFVNWMKERWVNTMFFTPSVLGLIPKHELRHVENIIVGGESCPYEIAQDWCQGRRFFIAYGPTEASVYSTLRAYRSEEDKRVPIGKPIPNAEIYVLDKWMNAVPIGVEGELYIGGQGLARGYANGAHLNAERFVPKPFGKNAGERLYRTGDRAKWREDGNLEFLGRVDHQVNIHGNRIELEEIESVLGEHSRVKQLAVKVWDEGQGGERLVGYVVAKEGMELEKEDLENYLQKRLPNYMVPRVWVKLDAMPLTANGKVDRKRLPKAKLGASEERYVGARSEMEEVLARIWKEVLNVDRIGIKDNFFELGGDSILSIQIVARARQRGLQLAVRDIFQYQTIAELAAISSPRALIEAEQGEVTGDVPLTPIQQYFFTHNSEKPNHYNHTVLFHTSNMLDPTLLDSAFRCLLRHHDALRMRFYSDGTSWTQRNEPWEPQDTCFFCLDLSSLSTEQSDRALPKVIEHLQTAVDIEAGPLLRAAYFRLGAREDRLLITIHHLVVDGVSWRILIEDLQNAYRQLASTGTMDLPLKTTSFQRWAEALKEYAQSGPLQAQQDYWLKVEHEEQSSLLVDFPEGENTIASSHTRMFRFDAKITRELLQELPKKHGTQAHDALLAALLKALGEWTGFWNWGIHVEGHGRESIVPGVDLSRTVGWFTTIYPVQLNTEAGMNNTERLLAVHSQMSSIPDNGIGYGLLKYLSPSGLVKDSGFAISFNYLGQFSGDAESEKSMPIVLQSAGITRNQEGHREHLLEVTGSVQQGSLQVQFGYSSNIFLSTTIESVGQAFVTALENLVRESSSAIAEPQFIQTQSWDDILRELNEEPSQQP